MTNSAIESKLESVSSCNQQQMQEKVPQHISCKLNKASPSSRLRGGAAAPCTPTVNRTRAAATMDFIIVDQCKSRWAIASEFHEAHSFDIGDWVGSSTLSWFQ
jgi:hypothetical protein